MGRTKEFRDIALAMLRTGLLGYGGGPSTIPLFRYEAVERYQWVSDGDFAEALAVANTLPGPIATKMAAHFGYRNQGILGAILAVACHILPTSLAMVGLFGAFVLFGHSRIVNDMISAVNPVIAVMLGMMAKDFLSKTWRGLGRLPGTTSLVLAFILLAVLNLSMGLVVLAFLIYGAVHHRCHDVASRWLRRAIPISGGESNGEAADITSTSASNQS